MAGNGGSMAGVCSVTMAIWRQCSLKINAVNIVSMAAGAGWRKWRYGGINEQLSGLASKAKALSKRQLWRHQRKAAKMASGMYGEAEISKA